MHVPVIFVIVTITFFAKSLCARTGRLGWSGLLTSAYACTVRGLVTVGNLCFYHYLHNYSFFSLYFCFVLGELTCMLFFPRFMDSDHEMIGGADLECKALRMDELMDKFRYVLTNQPE